MGPRAFHEVKARLLPHTANGMGVFLSRLFS
jgi:hypothetical protein